LPFVPQWTKINFGLQRNFRVGRFGPANILFRKQSNLF